ncbi:hypothetical protein BLA23254_04662 [Burkholderia lata]|uniref:Uncharacterized protein n=2 Tax=Burkholderia lata (strain ATCC 17760 / DSM 23089 / LMG 22485 / NCIMB 9086 / R18194 / 383) TaxID=482957 RepID=A0A6P2NU20_BURL3|nr:hypothetical protein BLA23254_04662 [Burkholderia lata]
MDIEASTHGAIHVMHAHDQAAPSRTMQEEAARRAAGGKKQWQTKMHRTSTSAILFTALSDTTMRRSAFRHGMNLILYTFHSIYFDDK